MTQLQHALPGGIHAELAPAADLVKPDRRERAEQGKAGGQRKQHRQRIGAGRPGGQDHADQRVHDDDEDQMRRLLHEVVKAGTQAIVEVADFDAAHVRIGRCAMSASIYVKFRHDCSPFRTVMDPGDRTRSEARSPGPTTLIRDHTTNATACRGWLPEARSLGLSIRTS